MEQYVNNCLTYKQTNIRWDLPSELLNLLPILDQLWQHISMDFISYPKDKKGFDSIFIIVNRFSKTLISISYYKTITVKDMAKL